MVRRTAVLTCGVAVAMLGFSGVAYASHGDDDDGDYDDGGAYSFCPQSHSDSSNYDGGKRGRGYRYRYDLDDPDEADYGSDRGYRASCGGIGGEAGENVSSCGSSLLPAGAHVTDCRAPSARGGADGPSRY